MLLLPLKVLIIDELFMALANLMQFVGIYKMYTKETYIKNLVFYYYGNLIKPKKIETKNTVINEKSYRDLVIYSTRYDRGKIITMLSLSYHDLKNMRKKYLMVVDYAVD